MKITPKSFSKELKKALELDNSGDWDGAHTIVQQIDSPISFRIHAYLHRKEGDLGNAQYWYNRADSSTPTCSLEEEWKTLNNMLENI